MNRVCLAVAAAGLMFFAVDVQSQILYRVTFVDSLPGSPEQTSRPYAINDESQATGYALHADYRSAAYLWQQSHSLIDLRFGAHNIGYALNEVGHVAGDAWVEVPGEGVKCHAFLWSPEGGMVDLGTLGGLPNESGANAINDLDQVVGFAAGSEGNQAFLWTAGQGMVALGVPPGDWDFGHAYAINNEGQVLCLYVGTSSTRYYTWDAEHGLVRVPRTPDGRIPQPSCINNLGQMGGWMLEEQEAYLWDPTAGYTMLGRLGEFDSTDSVALNDHGKVLGVSITYDGPITFYDYFIWDAVHGVRRLVERLDPCLDPELSITRAYDLNNLGQIAIRFQIDGAILTPYIAADPDLDGDTDLADLATVLANFGRTQVPTFAQGDIDEDTDVDLDDLAHVLVNFGNHCP